MALIENRQYGNQARLGILVLNRNGKNWLDSVFRSLRSDDYPNKQIYLVDNASNDGSVELTLQRYSEVTVIRMPHNLGYCMAYNLAMPHAFDDGCDWVIWANSDIKIEPGCLSELVRIAQCDQHIGVLGPAFLSWEGDGPNYYMLGNHSYAIPAMQSQSREPIDVEWVEGSFLMVSRRCIEAVGPLDPYLFFYWEETDFCRRARYQGWRVVLVPSAIARHFAGGSSDHHNQSFINIYQSRNYYIYELANPFQSFTENLKDAIHLFLVKLKANNGYLSGEIRAFSQVIRDIRIVHKKWVRDRMGVHPPLTTEEFQSARIKFIQARQ